MYYLSFYNWLISLSMLSSKFTYIVSHVAAFLSLLRVMVFHGAYILHLLYLFIHQTTFRWSPHLGFYDLGVLTSL